MGSPTASYGHIIRPPSHVTFACFILDSYCEVHEETLSEEKLKESCSYEREFQPPTYPNYGAAFNETRSKHIRQLFAKFFPHLMKIDGLVLLHVFSLFITEKH